MLFTGDAGSSPEKKMIEMGEDLEADLLQAGHHGSSTSNSYFCGKQTRNTWSFPAARAICTDIPTKKRSVVFETWERSFSHR